MISSVIRSVPLRIAAAVATARSIFSSPIVPSERVRSFEVSLLLCRSDGYLSGMIFSKEASSFRDSLLACQRGRTIGTNRFSTEGTVRMTRIIFLGPETDQGDSKLIGKKPKRVQESLLFCGGADFREIHFVEREDAEVDLRQGIQGKNELFLGRGAGAELLGQLQQDGVVQSGFLRNAGALQIEDRRRDRTAAAAAGLASLVQR
jgi:hypothetical protein